MRFLLQLQVACMVLDGAAIIQMLKPTGAKTFDENAHQVVISYVASQLRNESRLDLVWDVYVTDSLKVTARAKRGKGERSYLCVFGSAAIPGNNGRTSYASTATRPNCSMTRVFIQEGKELVVTDGRHVFSTSALQNLDTLAPCSHEEVDSRMLLHAAHAAHHGHHQILIWTVDTDAMVLAVSVADHLPEGTELWNRQESPLFGSPRNSRYITEDQKRHMPFRCSIP